MPNMVAARQEEVASSVLVTLPRSERTLFEGSGGDPNQNLGKPKIKKKPTVYNRFSV